MTGTDDDRGDLDRDEAREAETRAEWDLEAGTFDDEPHHSLLDPAMRAAWWELLTRLLPGPPAAVADLGCGTGSLSVLLAEHGYDVTGVDLSPRMVALALAKAAAHEVPVRFAVGNAAEPELGGRRFEVVLARHVVWALPDPAAALGRWTRMLEPGGRLVLIEGMWSTGAGIGADDLVALVGAGGARIDVEALTDPALWGHPLSDERYALTVRP